MRYVGVDLHKHSLTVVIVDEHGNVLLKERLATKSVRKVEHFFASIERPYQLVVEAIGFYHWFWDLVQPYPQKMFLANAAEVRRLLAGRPKCDFRDAYGLADFLRLGLFEQNFNLRAFVPDPVLRELRQWTRRRNSVARQSAREKNCFRRILLKNNLPGPKALTVDRATAWLQAYEKKVSEQHRFILRQILSSMILLQQQVNDLEYQIEQFLVRHPEHHEAIRRLRTLPGVALVVAATLRAELGDVTRFDRPEELVNYVGLDPRNFVSDQTVRHGRITKQGPRDARWVLQQAAWVGIRTDRFVKSVFHAKCRKLTKKVAAVVIARKYLLWIFAMFKKNEDFRAQAA